MQKVRSYSAIIPGERKTQVSCKPWPRFEKTGRNRCLASSFALQFLHTVDALAHLAMLNVSTDRRHDRRPFSESELTAILHAAYNGARVRRMSGPDRAMLYVVAGYTGLRASELASLSPRQLHLGHRPSVGKSSGRVLQTSAARCAAASRESCIVAPAMARVEVLQRSRSGPATGPRERKPVRCCNTT